MKAFAIASVVALILLLIGLDLSLRRKQQRFDEERAKAAQEEAILSSEPPPKLDPRDVLRRIQP